MTATQHDIKLAQAIDGLWARLQQDYDELPDVRIVLTSATEAGRKPNRLGHHHAHSNGTEIVVYPKATELSAEELTGVILHEAAHALCKARDVQDTAPTRAEYHNQNFERAAAELGLHLTAGRDPKRGAHTAGPLVLAALKSQVRKVAAALELRQAA